MKRDCSVVLKISFLILIAYMSTKRKLDCIHNGIVPEQSSYAIFKLSNAINSSVEYMFTGFGISILYPTILEFFYLESEVYKMLVP